MTVGVGAFRSIQIGQETTAGTAVAATMKWLGTLDMEETHETYQPIEDVGMLTRYTKSQLTSKQVAITHESDLNYEQCLVPFLAGIRGDVTGSATGGTAPTPGTPYIWDFTPNLTAMNNPKTFTVEYGDSTATNEAFESPYCIATSIEIRGAVDEPLTISTDMMGQKMDTSTLTPNLTVPTVNVARAQNTKLYIEGDAAAIDAGTADAKAKTLIDFTWHLDTGVHTKKFCGGETYYEDVGEARRSPELDMTFEWNGNALTEHDYFDGTTKRFVRLETTGDTIGSADGTAYPYKLTLDMCGVYTSWDSLGDRDGNDIVAVHMTCLYDSTWGKDWCVKVQNAQATWNGA
jgi:hypothetical protein